MRIIHLVSYALYSGPLPPTLGLARAQRALGHEVSVIFDNKRGAFNDYEEAALPYMEEWAQETATELNWGRKFSLSAKSSPRELYRDWQALRQILHRGQVDVVHVHLSHEQTLLALAGLGLKTSAGPPLPLKIRTVHAERSLTPRFGQKWINRCIDGWIVRAHEHKQRLKTLLPTASLNREPAALAVIKSGLDEQFLTEAQASSLSKAAARQRLQQKLASLNEVKPTDFLLGQVALLADRGQCELLQAVASLASAYPQLHLLLVGKGEHEAALRTLVQELGLTKRVHFAGYLQGRELHTAYAALDAAFLAKPGNDASARAALEALAYGLPVIGVCRGALGELLAGERGFLVADSTPSQLLEGLKTVLTAPVEAAKRGRLGAEYVYRERRFKDEALSTLDFYTLLARDKVAGVRD